MIKNKKSMIIFVLMLVIGFAAVSTSLIIGGITHLVFNNDDFKVRFSKAVLNETDISSTAIIEDGLKISFDSNTLSLANIDKTVLDFEVKNDSRFYDALVSIECGLTHTDEALEVSDYLDFNYDLKSNLIPAMSKENGNITVALKKTVTENVDFDLTCEIVATPQTRESVGVETVKSYSGTLKYESGDVVDGLKMVFFADSNYILAPDNGSITITDVALGEYEGLILFDMTPVMTMLTGTKEELQDYAQAPFTVNITEDNVEISGFVIEDLKIENVIKD